MIINKGTKQGFILISVLVIVVVLSIVSWSISRRSAVEMNLLERYQGSLRSYAAARAGINVMMDLLNTSPAVQDTLYSCGISIAKEKSPKEIFSHIEVDEQAYASVEWEGSGYGSSDRISWHGLQDEQGKININAINDGNYQILSSLFEIKGLDRSQADALALAIVMYKGVLEPKQKPFDHILELLEIEGMTKDFFDKIKQDLTVYGDAQNGLWINVKVANDEVLQAVVLAAKRVNPDVNTTAILTKAYSIRNGADGIPFTGDDGAASSIDESPDGGILNWPPALRMGNSNYLHARVTGVDKITNRRTVIDVIINRTQGFGQNRIIGWHRD